MKGLIIYIPENNFSLLRQILQKNNIDAITYFDIMGKGQLERPSSERIIQGYRTNETFVPEFASRIRVELIVEDPKVMEIIDAIKRDGNIKGNIFVFDILDSY